MTARSRKTAFALAAAILCAVVIPHPASAYASVPANANPTDEPRDARSMEAVSSDLREARPGDEVRWAPSIQAGLKEAAARLIPLVVVVDGVRPARDADLFEEARVAKAMSRFVLARGSVESIERLLPLADALDGARYAVITATGQVIARLAGPDADETLASDLHEVWEQYRSQLIGRLTTSLKSRHEQARHAALRDAATFLGSAPDSKSLRTAVARYLKRLKRDFDRRGAWNTLADADNEAALSFIAPSLAAKSPATRRSALDVFLKTTPRESFTAVLTKRARVEKDEGQLHQLVAILDRYEVIDDMARRALVRLVGHRLPSVRALATLAVASPDTRISLYSRLLGRIQKDAHENVRLAAILGIAKLGDARAVGTLDRARRRAKKDTAVRAALELAISALRGLAPPKELDDSIATLRKEIDRSGTDAKVDSPRDDPRYTGRKR